MRYYVQVRSQGIYTNPERGWSPCDIITDECPVATYAKHDVHDNLYFSALLEAAIYKHWREERLVTRHLRGVLEFRIYEAYGPA